MRFVISSANLPAWKAFVQISKNVSQHSCFYLKPDGVYTQGMDGSQTSLYDGWFPKNWFALYEYDPATDVPDVMVHTEHLTRVMASASMNASSSSSSPSLCVEVSPNKARLVLTVFGNDGHKTNVFEIQLLDIDSELIHVEDKDCSIRFAMSAKALYDIVHEHATFGEKTTFKCNQTQLELKTSGEVCESTFLDIAKGDGGIVDFEAESEYVYRLTYHTKQLERLLQFFKFCNNANAKAHVSFDDNHPFSVKYNHVNQTDVTTASANEAGRTASVNVYLAPMVYTEGDGDENVDDLREALEATDMMTEQ